MTCIFELACSILASQCHWRLAKPRKKSRRTAHLLGSHPTAPSKVTGRRTRSCLKVVPAALGKLVVLYEHSVFTQGTIWGIDSFDQWGVELGKVLAQRIIPELENKTMPNLQHDSSTNALIRLYRKREIFMTIQRSPGPEDTGYDLAGKPGESKRKPINSTHRHTAIVTKTDQIVAAASGILNVSAHVNVPLSEVPKQLD